MKLFDAELTPRRIAFAALAAALLSLPFLRAGFFADDYIHLMAIKGYDVGGARAYDLYRFVDGDPLRAKALVERGPWMWWLDPNLRAAFMRPLPSALAQLDHWLFGIRGLGWHVHNLLWYVALVAAVGVLYRRIFPYRAAALAALLFAIDDGHAFTSGWVASRYAIIAAFLSTVALYGYWRWREQGWRRGLYLALASYTVSLGCGESALCLPCFLAAYELFSRESWRRRLVALAPFAALTAVYLVVHRLGGYGTRGSGVYFDPIAEPARFLAAAPQRMTALLGCLIGSTPLDMWMLVPETHAPLVAAGAVATVVFALLFRSTLRAVGDDERRTLSWLAAGAVLAIVPTLGAGPGSRLLVFPSVGAFPVIARVAAHAWSASRLERAGAVWLLAVNLVISPIGFVGQYPLLERRAGHSRATMHRFALSEKRPLITVIRTTDVFVGVYGAGALAVEDQRLNDAWNLVAQTSHPLRITRTGERQLDVEVLGGTLLDSEMEQVWRYGGVPEGYQAKTRTFTVRVTGTAGGKPNRLAIEFTEPPGSPDNAVMVQTRAGLEPFAFPPVGETVTLPEGPNPFEE